MNKNNCFGYNVNLFSFQLEKTAIQMAKMSAMTPGDIPIFPMIPDDKTLLYKHMLSVGVVDASAFDTRLCIELYKAFYGERCSFEILQQSASKIETVLTNLRNVQNESILVKAALFHYSIVINEIFPEYNEQAADILCVMYLYKCNMLPSPYFYLDCRRYFENERDLAQTLDSYIFIFLTALYKQAEKQITYLMRAMDLRKEISGIVFDNINRPQSTKIIDLIFGTPILTAGDMVKALGVTRGQAVRYLHVLEENGILIGDDKQRSRTFRFDKLLDIVNDDV